MFVCSPKDLCWNPNVQGVGIRKWGLQEVLGSRRWSSQDGISILIRETPQSSLVPSALWGHNERSVTQERALLQTMQPSWSQTSRLQNREKQISVVCKPPSLIFSHSSSHGLRRLPYWNNLLASRHLPLITPSFKAGIMVHSLLHPLLPAVPPRPCSPHRESATQKCRKYDSPRAPSHAHSFSRFLSKLMMSHSSGSQHRNVVAILILPFPCTSNY